MRPSVKWRLLLAAALLLPAVATWADGPSPAHQQEFTKKLQALSAAADRLESTLQALEGFGNRLVLDVSRVGPSRAQFLPDPPAGQVTVQLLAEAVNDRIPGSFRFYVAAPEAARLFMTESLPRGQSIPKGQELKDGIAFVEPGKFYTLQVVYQNPTDHEVKFLVPGGIVDPPAALPLVRNRCWCAAVPFTAPAGGAFYRTIQVGVGPNTPPGAKAIVIWPIVPL